MAGPLGWWDETGLASGWFDATAVTAGWFDRESIDAAGGPTSYTLTADAGSFSLTGQSAGLEYGRMVSASGGSYALSVGNAGVEYGRQVVAAGDSLSLSVGDAGLAATRTIAADGGSYSLSGSAAVEYSRVIDAAGGSFALTVGDAGLDYGSTLTHYSIAADGAVLAALIGDANIVYAHNQGGAMYGLYGAIDFRLEPLPPEDEEKEIAAPKKAVQIIKRVAEKQAEKQEFKLAPLKVAFQWANYKYQPNYADIYRRAYEAALVKLRQDEEDDDEEAILMLM